MVHVLDKALSNGMYGYAFYLGALKVSKISGVFAGILDRLDHQKFKQKSNR